MKYVIDDLSYTDLCLLNLPINLPIRWFCNGIPIMLIRNLDVDNDEWLSIKNFSLIYNPRLALIISSHELINQAQVFDIWTNELMQCPMELLIQSTHDIEILTSLAIVIPNPDLTLYIAKKIDTSLSEVRSIDDVTWAINYDRFISNTNSITRSIGTYFNHNSTNYSITEVLFNGSVYSEDSRLLNIIYMLFNSSNTLAYALWQIITTNSYTEYLEAFESLFVNTTISSIPTIPPVDNYREDHINNLFNNMLDNMRIRRQNNEPTNVLTRHINEYISYDQCNAWQVSVANTWVQLPDWESYIDINEITNICTNLLIEYPNIELYMNNKWQRFLYPNKEIHPNICIDLEMIPKEFHFPWKNIYIETHNSKCRSIGSINIKRPYYCFPEYKLPDLKECIKTYKPKDNKFYHKINLDSDNLMEENTYILFAIADLIMTYWRATVCQLFDSYANQTQS